MSTVSTVSTRRHRTLASAPAARGFRADVQALRALAVLLVVLYHAGVPGIRAGYVGVDVFFVISGFLITTHLVGEATRTGRIAFAAFYARRVRRLLPAALFVVLGTVAAALLTGSPAKVADTAVHAWFTTFYGLNYRLAAEGVDYQNATADPSPLQHYWSLAVEEQFYVVWPLLIVAALWVARRTGRPALPAVVATVTTVTVLSLAASVVLTASSPTVSYFALHTRAWELGAGGLLALGARRVAAMPRRAAALASWAGFATIAVSAVAYSDATAFPGSAALLPVGGAVLVIAAGCGGEVASVTRALGGRAVQGVGALSYGWYLWHWPVLLLYPAILRLGSTPWPLDLAACVGALVLAALTHRLVERPAQALRWGTRAWLGAGAAMSAITALLVAVVWSTLPPGVGDGPAVTLAPPADLVAAQADLESALALERAPSNLTPDTWRARDDEPVTRTSEQRCMADYPVVEQGPCVYGDPDGARTVVLFGDSHMEQWQPAFDAAGKDGGAGEDGGWRVVSWTKSSCPLSDRPIAQHNEPSREYVECAAWRDATVERTVAMRPDLVVVTQSDEISRASTPEQYAEGTLATVDRLREAGLDVTYVLDNPSPAVSVPECVSAHLDEIGECTVQRGASGEPALRDALGAALERAGVTVADPAPWLCAGEACPAVVGQRLVYRDNNHVTATYSRWLAPMAAAVLAGDAQQG